MLTSQTLTRARPRGSARALGPLAQEWPVNWKGIDLVAVEGRPANSPIWVGSEGDALLMLAQNTESGVYTAIVHVVGCPGVADEHTNENAALNQALSGYASRANTGPRQRDIVQADRDLVAGIRARPDPPGAGSG